MPPNKFNLKSKKKSDFGHNIKLWNQNPSNTANKQNKIKMKVLMKEEFHNVHWSFTVKVIQVYYQ